MAKALWKFTKREVMRILAAARAVGFAEPTLRFCPDGTIELLTGTHGHQQAERNEWDED